MGLEIPPVHVSAVALAVFGLGLMAAAFMGEGFGPLRMFFGIVLLVAAFLLYGLQILIHHAAPAQTGPHGEGT